MDGWMGTCGSGLRGPAAAQEPDLEWIVCFQSLVFVSPAGFGKRGASGAAQVPEAAAVMPAHHKGGSTHRGANTRLL
jgi:hypothetical protein